MIQKKRIMALVLVLMMLMSTWSVIIAEPGNAQLISEKGKRMELNIQNFDENDEIRVIVEIAGTPIIEEATQKGIHVSDMDKNEKNSKKEKLLKNQNEIITNAETQIGSIEVHQQFTTAFNGFSTTIKVKDVEQLASQAGVVSVKEVNRYERPEPLMDQSSMFTEAKYVNDTYGYTGEGMVVAVLDTGIDVDHEAMVIDEDAIPALDANMVASFIDENELKGHYFTEKVPYGYNYFDDDDYIKDDVEGASMHGMHVSGTIAANGDVIKGIAPNAQILMMRVFSNKPDDPYTYSDIIVAAIEDAIDLGADVMNLSLGSTAGNVDVNDPEQQAVTSAVKNGIFVSISAGNSAYYGSGFDNPYAKNPDIGLVGAPSVTGEATSVASLNNMSVLYTSTLSNDTYGLSVEGYGRDEWVGIEAELVEVLGYGNITDYDNIDVEGKIVVVSRGELTFYDKTMNAINEGAIGIVVYNNDPSRSIYYDQGFWGIPFMLTDYDDGIEMKTMFEAYKAAVEAGNTDLLLGVGNTTKSNPNPNTGFISDFSSYGSTSTLEFKPEITAPGGGIYSTLNDDSYGLMSGTSMAAPHVTGGATLVLQRINSDENILALGLTEIEKAELCKNLLMNTAVPIMDINNPTVYDSVRVQGAGSMNIRNAVETKVVVTEVESKSAKISLGEINKNALTFTLNVQNFGDNQVVYQMDTMITSDYADPNSGGLPINTLISVKLDANVEYFVSGRKLDGNKLVVNPNESMVVKVTASRIDTSMIEKYYENGYFIDGFVTFEVLNDDAESTASDLSIPLMGFVGDWEAADAFDSTVYSKEESFYGVTGLLNEEGYFLGNVLGNSYEDDSDDFFNGKFASISPNGDGYSDGILPIFSMTRNLINMSFKIENEKGRVIAEIEKIDSLPKTWYDSGQGPYYHLYDELLWNGLLNGKYAPQGQYYYVITGYLADGVTQKTLKMPFKIDVTNPVIKSIQYAKVSNTIKVLAVDNIGIKEYILIDSNYSVLARSTNGEFSLVGYEGSISDLMIAVFDYAENLTVQHVSK